MGASNYMTEPRDFRAAPHGDEEAHTPSGSLHPRIVEDQKVNASIMKRLKKFNPIGNPVSFNSSIQHQSDSARALTADENYMSSANELKKSSTPKNDPTKVSKKKNKLAIVHEQHETANATIPEFAETL